MKLIIFILATALLHISQAQNDWALVPSFEVNTSPEIQGLLSFGARYIAQKAIEDLTVPDTPYDVIQTFDVFRLTEDGGVKYNISVQLDNLEGTKINATFTIQYQPSRNRMRVTSYTYHYTITETACLNDDASKVDEIIDELAEEEFINEEEFNLPEGWLQVDLNDVMANSEIQDLLDAGAKRVIEGAVKDGKIPDSTYTVVDVYKVLTQVVSGTKYKFYVKLDDGQGTTVKAIFVVYFQSWTGRKDVTCYRYFAVTEKNEEQGNEEEVIPEEEEPAVEEKEEEPAVEEKEEEETLLGGWSQVDLSEVESSDEIGSLLNFGADYVEKKAIDAGKVPDTAFEVVQIYSVLRQVVSGLNYKFNVKLDNGAGTTINATYEVWYQAWTDKKSVTSFEFTSLTTEMDCKDLDPDKIDYPAEDDELPTEESNEEEQIILTKDYSEIDASEVLGNEELQHFLDLGVEAVLKKGKKDGKIPDSNYEVSEIYRIWGRAENGNKYKFHIKLDNGSGVTVNAIFVVYSQAWSGQTKVTCLRYSVHEN